MKRIISLIAVAALIGVVLFVSRPVAPEDEIVADLRNQPVVAVPPAMGTGQTEGAVELEDVLDEDTGAGIERDLPSVVSPEDEEAAGDPSSWPEPDIFPALEFAADYYTLTWSTPLAEHRSDLGVWTTATFLEEVLTNDPEGLFASSDAVRASMNEDSIGVVRQHDVVRVGHGVADVAVVVDVLVTGGGQERSDSHLMLITLGEPTTPDGRWLVTGVVIDPEPGNEGEGVLEFPVDET